jgi:GNAT superfamily N-acetyltransferase
MFVRPHARRLGVATGLLETVEADARRTGAGRIVLETGTRSEAAIRLYERCRYLHIPPFGQYVGQPFSVCFAKVLG